MIRARSLAAISILGLAFAAGSALWNSQKPACALSDLPQSADRPGGTAEDQLGEVVSELDKVILVIYQGSRGDYWFGSDGQGVYRYDGRQLLHYGSTAGLGNTHIRGIQEDAKGHIYFDTHGGVYRFDGNAISKLQPVKAGAAMHGWELGAGDLWFKGEAGRNGPYRYDGELLHDLELPWQARADEIMAQPHPPQPYSPYEVYHIYKDRRGSMWFGTSNLGVCRFDGESIEWMYEDELIYTPYGGSFGIRSIHEDSTGGFWICTTLQRFEFESGLTGQRSSGLLSYAKAPGIDPALFPAGEEPLYCMSILEAPEGALWLTTYNQGVWKYENGELTRYSVRIDGKEITLYAMYRDRQGELWLATHEHGALRFDHGSFEVFRPGQ